MSKTKSSSTPAAGAPPASIPATGPGSRPRKAKVSGPVIFAVGKQGNDEAITALVKAHTWAQAVEKVTGKYVAYAVDAEQAVALALANGIKGIVDATADESNATTD